MADYEETQQALLDALADAARESVKSGNGTTTESYASAARQLGEAYAWLVSPSQAH